MSDCSDRIVQGSLFSTLRIQQSGVGFQFQKPTKNQRCKLFHIFSIYDKLSNKIRRPVYLVSGAFLG